MGLVRTRLVRSFTKNCPRILFVLNVQAAWPVPIMGARSVFTLANSDKETGGKRKGKDTGRSTRYTQLGGGSSPCCEKSIGGTGSGDACIEAIGNENQEGALMALSYMHDSKIVEQL